MCRLNNCHFLNLRYNMLTLLISMLFQVVVGVEYTEDDIFVRYVTMDIEDVKEGDMVFSYDTETGCVEQKEVTDVFVRETDHLNYLTIIDSTGEEQIIETTDEHPFWVIDSATGIGRWVDAKDLQTGDRFLDANGNVSTLENKDRIEYHDGIAVYNFTVEGNHDYFVIAAGEYGQTCILVHNAGIGYRVMSNDEYIDASKGIWKDSDLVKGDKIEMGNKWLWDNPESAAKWKSLCDANGDKGQIITKVETINPIESYPAFPHAPQGTAYHVPIPDLIKASK